MCYLTVLRENSIMPYYLFPFYTYLSSLNKSYHLPLLLATKPAQFPKLLVIFPATSDFVVMEWKDKLKLSWTSG